MRPPHAPAEKGAKDSGWLSQTFPRLSHVADVRAWPGIQRHGLLSPPSPEARLASHHHGPRS